MTLMLETLPLLPSCQEQEKEDQNMPAAILGVLFKCGTIALARKRHDDRGVSPESVKDVTRSAQPKNDP